MTPFRALRRRAPDLLQTRRKSATPTDHQKIITRHEKLLLTCGNSDGGASGARVELRGFEPLTP